jgi:hypothetical protein
MVVLGFGILGVASMQTSAARGTALGRRLTEANNLASQQIELFMTLPYDDPLLAANTPSPTDILMPDDTDNDDSPDNDSLDGALGYTISWKVTDDSPIQDMKTIQATVSTNDATRTVRMIYYKADL